MKIDLSSLTAGVFSAVSHTYSPIKMDLNNQDVEFCQDIEFNGEVEKGDGFLLVKGEVNFRWKETCSRCLARTTQDVKRRIDLSLTIEQDQTFYDFTPELREEIFLSYPVKFLCKEDCKGLCGNCGANLNVAPCGCHNNVKADSPFSILKKFKEGTE